MSQVKFREKCCTFTQREALCCSAAWQSVEVSIECGRAIESEVNREPTAMFALNKYGADGDQLELLVRLLH